MHLCATLRFIYILYYISQSTILHALLKYRVVVYAAQARANPSSFGTRVHLYNNNNNTYVSRFVCSHSVEKVLSALESGDYATLLLSKDDRWKDARIARADVVLRR